MLTAAALILPWSGTSHADSTDLSQIAVAQALVDEGRKLLAAGKIDEACPRFEEAVRVAPSGIGAQAQLADCYEKAGRLARAWAMWLQVAGASSRAQQARRAHEARARADALSPRVPRLAVVVSEHADGIAITRDGKALPPEQWGLPVPVDPGRHMVRAVAPGKEAWVTELDAKSGEVRIHVPVLQPKVAPAPPPSPAPAPRLAPPPPPPRAADERVGRAQRRTGIVVGALGIGALEVAGVLVAVNLTKSADYDACQSCWGDPNHPLLNAARVTRAGAIVSGVTGALMVASGVAIYATAPSPRQRTSLLLSPSGAWMSVRW